MSKVREEMRVSQEQAFERAKIRDDQNCEGNQWK